MTALEGYETARQAAERFGLTDSQVRRLCIDGRIEGATKVAGQLWLIPSDAWPDYPYDKGRPPKSLQRS